MVAGRCHERVPLLHGPGRQIERHMDIDVDEARNILCPFNVTGHPIERIGNSAQHTFELRLADTLTPTPRCPCFRLPARNSPPENLSSAPRGSTRQAERRCPCRKECTVESPRGGPRNDRRRLPAHAIATRSAAQYSFSDWPGSVLRIRNAAPALSAVPRAFRNLPTRSLPSPPVR